MTLKSNIVLNYFDLKSKFDDILISTSRGFDTKYEFLESWVPNENLNQSVKDLINAAIEYNEKYLTINFSQSEFDIIDQNYFLEEFKNKIIFEKNKLIFHD